MDFKFLMPLLLSVYAASLATYTFYYDRFGRLKFIHEYIPNLSLPNGDLIKMHQFKIINISGKKRTIYSIGYRFNKSDETIYSPIQEFAKPVSLEFGDLINYEVFHSEWDRLFGRKDMKKFQLIVTDTTEKRYKYKWITVRK